MRGRQFEDDVDAARGSDLSVQDARDRPAEEIGDSRLLQAQDQVRDSGTHGHPADYLLRFRIPSVTPHHRLPIEVQGDAPQEQFALAGVRVAALETGGRERFGHRLQLPERRVLLRRSHAAPHRELQFFGGGRRVGTRAWLGHGSTVVPMAQPGKGAKRFLPRSSHGARAGARTTRNPITWCRTSGPLRPRLADRQLAE